MATITLTPAADPVAIAQWLADRISAALDATDGPIAITVPGGRTPFPVLSALVKHDLPFARISVWPNDDRMVPEDHPASNLAKIRAVLEPAGAQIVGLEEGQTPPRFALALLGMGEDGHIASLFPNTDPQASAPARVIRITPDPLPPEAPFDRLSLTIPALVNTDALAFLITGDSIKRQLFEAGAKGENDLPVARLLAATDQTVECFC
ncbi:6-phosphogluconolactonase [Novosphingobium rosa]|uniref:6-phosphogluconolactonase n=1 Tax=Novosphingobium rosa TaxID=76978 RepID=UPI00082F78BF|nr:6-phosphogluconolactonase [Novosphingobium rosa]